MMQGNASLKIVIAFALIVAAIGIYFYLKNSPLVPDYASDNEEVVTPPAQPQSSDSVKPPEWKTYKNDAYGFQFSYPTGFVLTEEASFYCSGITSSNKSVVYQKGEVLPITVSQIPRSIAPDGFNNDRTAVWIDRDGCDGALSLVFIEQMAKPTTGYKDFATFIADIRESFEEGGEGSATGISVTSKKVTFGGKEAYKISISDFSVHQNTTEIYYVEHGSNILSFEIGYSAAEVGKLPSEFGAPEIDINNKVYFEASEKILGSVRFN